MAEDCIPAMFGVRYSLINAILGVYFSLLAKENNNRKNPLLHIINIYLPNFNVILSKYLIPTNTQMTAVDWLKKWPWLSTHSWFHNLWNVILPILPSRSEVSFPTLVSELVLWLGQEDVVGSNIVPTPRLSLKRLYILLSSLLEPCHQQQKQSQIVC